ncbi:MAG: recombinase family protein [Chloroflexota bacterium]
MEQKWQIDEKEADLVRYIYHLYLNEGLGTMKIPFRLNEEGYRTRQGNPWNFDPILNVLKHPGYKGLHPRGIKMPVIIDEATWERAQEKRIKARHIRRNPKYWLLQGRCICGECGHTLACQQRDQTENRYYSCSGRYIDSHLDGSPRCTLPRVRADYLEKAVWRRLKEVLSDSEVLKNSLRNNLAELKQRRTYLDSGTSFVDKELTTVSAKKERLGLAYTDGAIPKDVYEKKLHILAKKEGELLKSRSNLSPELRMELDEVERSIDSLEKALDGKSGRILLTEIGIWMEKIPEGAFAQFYQPIGNGFDSITVGAWDEPAMVRLENFFRLGYNGPLVEMVEENKVSAPRQVPRELVWQTLRGFLDTLRIKVYIFRDRAEIRGLIPPEVLEIPRDTERSRRGAITCSARGQRG